MITSKHFKEKEFQRCVPSCSLQDMTQEAMDVFDQVRDNAGIPLIINCAYRSKEWEIKKGRSGNSVHTQRCAIDIKCLGITTRYKIIKAALDAGITRIGIAKTFVHLDISKLNTQNVIWDY